MPLECPACRRPNNERLSECLYCGAELPVPDPPEEDAPEDAAAAERASDTGDRRDAASERTRPSLLVLAPSPTDESGRAPAARLAPDRIAAVSRILGLDAYLARKTLVTCYPKVLARGETEKLRALAIELARAKLELTLVTPEGLDRMGEARPATSLVLPDEGGVTLVGQEGREWIRPGSVTLLLQAEIRVQWVGPRREPDKRMRARERPPAAEDLEQVRSDYPVLEIHRSDGPRVRLHLAQFDFSGLGARARPSALLNLLGLIRRLREESPDAVLDDAFRFVPAESDPVDGVFGSFASNETQFDHYCCIVGAHWSEIRAGRSFGPKGDPAGAQPEGMS